MIVLADPLIALGWVTRLAAFGVLIDSLERLVCWPVFHDMGALGWSWLRLRRGFLQRGWFDVLFRFPVFLGILALRAVAALMLVVWPLHPVTSALGLSLIVMIGLLAHLRSAPYGCHGAHRMTLVIFGALILRRLDSGSAIVAEATLWFIALQACASYATAGWAKVLIPAWRQGTGVFAALNASMIGPAWFVCWLHHHPWMTRGVTWATLSMECTFPLVVVIGGPVSWLFLIWGLLFHISNAVILGLNHFVWAWVATYPAIWYVTTSGAP